jgi:hypothetical protein
VKVATRIVFASAFVLSALAPAFAAEEDMLIERNIHVSTVGSVAQPVTADRIRTDRAGEARAYVPRSPSVYEIYDFGIASQR